VLAAQGHAADAQLNATIDHDGHHDVLSRANTAPDDLVVPIDAATSRSRPTCVRRAARGARRRVSDPLDRVLILVDTSRRAHRS